MGRAKISIVEPHEDRDGRRILADGDRLAKEGDIAGAVEHYILYCEHVEASRSDGASNLRLIAVRRQILEMQPELHEVRRKLVENYVGLGLVEEAREQLERLLAEADEAMRDPALAYRPRR